MYKDPTEFRARFKAYKEGKMPYENGLPKFAGGTPGLVNPYTLPLLQEFEGFKDTVYLDGKGIPTIGWGFTDPSLVNKGRISRKEADAELQRLAGNVESDLISKLGIDIWKQMSPESQAALISYAYNYPAGFKDTTNFMKLWRAGKYWDAIDEVDAGMHDKANPGLKKRRLKEQLYLRKDPFFLATSSAPTKKTDAELKIPIINKTDATTVNKIVPQEQTHARWEGAENVSPYLTGKPTLKLIPKTTLPSPTNLPDPYEGWFERRLKSKKMLDDAFSLYLFDDEDSNDLLYAKNGKLPCFEMGTPEDVDMGEKRNTPISIEQVRNTPHEQGMSGADPIGKFIVESVGMAKGAKILGDILSAARIRRMADTYRNLRKYDQDILNYTGKSLRKLNMQFADKIARDGFLYSRPENSLYWILDPIMAGYTKLQSHPIIGPLIPFKDGKSPIHIKPANRGKLTRLKARTDKSESELYNDGNPAHKKMVVFARNARKWKH